MCGSGEETVIKIEQVNWLRPINTITKSTAIITIELSIITA